MTTLPPSLGRIFVNPKTQNPGSAGAEKKCAIALPGPNLSLKMICHFERKVGAGKEARTPDLNLGKVALYQLSYSRIARLNLLAGQRGPLF
jgi:hypothetical protein